MNKGLIIGLVSICLFSSCESHLKKSVGSASLVSNSSEINVALLEKSNYTATVSEMEESLISLLSSPAQTTRSRLYIPDSYKISCEKQENIICKSSKTTDRSIILEEDTEIPLYYYTVESENTDTKGYAITSTDRRIGLVLAFSNDGQLISDGEMGAFIRQSISDYVEKTVGSYEEYKSATRAAESRYKKNDAVLIDDYAKCSTEEYIFSNFIPQGGNSNCILPVKWIQGSPFNDVVNAEINDGKEYIAGCGPIALGQIFTVVRPFSNCSVPGYTDVIYDWDAMTEVNDRFGSNYIEYANFEKYSKRIEKQVACLAYELGIGQKATYKPATDKKSAETIVSWTNVKNYLTDCGISYDSSLYEWDNIVTSIDNGSPVLIMGMDTKIETIEKNKKGEVVSTVTNYAGGHLFVIDGYQDFNYYIKDANTQKTISENTSHFVHVNYGWNRTQDDGYYISGIFNSNNAPLADDNRSVRSRSITTQNIEGEKYSYLYNFKIIYNIGI